MKESSLVKRCIGINAVGGKARGRPRKTFGEVIRKDLW